MSLPHIYLVPTFNHIADQSKKEKEKDSRVIALLVQDNNQLKADVKQLENSFSELKNRYETLKALNDTYKRVSACSSPLFYLIDYPDF